MPYAQSEGIDFTGVVRDLQYRGERWGEHSETAIWNLRIERYDAGGNRLAPVPVEMRGDSFSGSVINGDVIRVKGSWRGCALRVEEFDNLTTGAQVRAMPTPRLPVAVLMILLGSIIFMFFSPFIVFFIFIVLVSFAGGAGPGHA